MALIIGVHKGKTVRLSGDAIGVHVLTVGDVDQTGVAVDVELDGKKFTLTEQERTELLPDVFAFAGTPNEKDFRGYGRIAFEAPRSIRIERIPTPAAA